MSEGQLSITEEVARQINPSLVIAFPFGENVDPGEDRAAPDASVNVETPSVVTDNWNSPKQVNVLLVEAGKWYLAPMNIGGSFNFKACTLSRWGSGSPDD